MTYELNKSIFKERMGKWLGHFCMDFYTTEMSRRAVKGTSNNMQYISVGYKVSKVLVKNRKLLTNYPWCGGTIVHTIEPAQ